MSRTDLPTRHFSVTSKLTHERADSHSMNIIGTFSLDGKGKVRAVFCSSFKDGADLRALVIDACICLSLLLQHGYTARAIRDKLTPSPQSILSTLIEEAIRVEEGK